MSDSEVLTAAADARPAILLAEDDPVTRMLLMRFLKKAGYEVDAVADGARAFEKLLDRYYPVLVTDWEMPGMDGLDLCKAVRSVQLDGYVYTLLLTARDSKEHVIAGLEAGADDYLIKPVHEPELIARLNTGCRILKLEQSLRAANESNRLLSITDSLTGVYNRRYLMEQLPREVDRGRRYGYPVTVIMCDIDHFKRVNDDWGHAAGDEVLQQFAGRVSASIRSASDWVARYGGEEFVMVLPETDLKGGCVVAEKIRTLISSQPFTTRCGEILVTSSFGVASTPVTGPDLSVKIDSLIKLADQCLYHCKAAGRNCTLGVELRTEAVVATEA